MRHYRVKKIAHILPWSTVGGVECATLRIAQSVNSEGFSHIAFHLPHATTVKSMFAGEGFETAEYQAIEPSYRSPFPYLRVSIDLAKEFRRRRINLIHCSDIPAGFHVALAGRLAGIPVLCHIRNRFDDLTWRGKGFLMPVNHFAFVSHDTWKNFPMDVKPKDGTVIYDGIDPLEVEVSESERQQLRDRYNIPKYSKLIGMVARVAPQKDYFTLTRAAKRIVAVEPNVRFLIVGDHSGTESYRQHYKSVLNEISKEGLDEYFVFTDFQTDVPIFLDLIDIFVLSTHCEGLPLVILEAMAQQKPVVATDIDGIPEIVSHNRTGLLCEHDDDESLASHLLNLLQNRELSERLALAGFESVKQNWSRESFANNMTNLYKRMLLAKGASSDIDVYSEATNRLKEEHN